MTPSFEVQDPSFRAAIPRVGVSACLLGERVRYDGGHRHSPRTAAALSGALVVPVCPEVEFGLGVPRPPIEIAAVSGGLRLRRPSDGVDLSDTFRVFARRRVQSLLAEGLDAMILKERSPSCGERGVPVREGAGVAKVGRGFFTAVLAEEAPWLPIVDDQDLDAITIEALCRRARLLAELRAATDDPARFPGLLRIFEATLGPHPEDAAETGEASVAALHRRCARVPWRP